MNILFLSSWYPTKFNPGNGIFVKRHAQAIAEYTNHIVTCIYIQKDRSLSRETYQVSIQRKEGITSCIVYYNPSKNKLIQRYRYQKALTRAMRLLQLTPDVVHLNIAFPAGILLWNRSVKKLPVLLTEHSSDYLSIKGSFQRKKLWQRYLIQRIYRKANHVTVVSNYLKNQLIVQKLIESPVTVVPNVVKTKNNLKITLTKKSGYNLLCIADLKDDVKNISGIIQTIDLLLKEGLDVRLNILGIGEDEKKLKKIARELGLLGKQIFFHGFLQGNAFDEIFNQTHVFVLNSQYETFSVATLEAIGRGVPVVVTSCGAPEDYVSPNFGVLVERNNVESLKQGIVHVIQHLPAYDSESMHKFVKKTYSEKNIAQSFNEIYSQIM